MNEKEYYEILLVLKEHNTNLTELINIGKILDYLFNENYTYELNPVLEYVSQSWVGLNWDTTLNIEGLVENMVEEGIVEIL